MWPFPGEARLQQVQRYSCGYAAAPSLGRDSGAGQNVPPENEKSPADGAGLIVLQGEAAQNGRTFAAWRPFGPFVTSNSTFWPSARVRKPCAWMAVWWQKTSSPPPSCVMNPKPFASLNHFTVPVAIAVVLFSLVLERRVMPPCPARK